MEAQIDYHEHIADRRQAGDMNGALAAAQAWVRARPGEAAGWHAFSDLLLAVRAYRQAVQCAERACALESAPRRKAHLAKCYAHAGDFAQALGYARLLSNEEGLGAAVLSDLAKTFSLAGCHREAWPLARGAAALAPDQTVLHYNAAMAARACGHTAAALGHLEAVIAANPRDWQAVKNRSDLKTWSKANNHITALEALRPDEAADATGYVLVSAALAKEYEDIGDPVRAFAYVKEGAAARRRQLDYDVAADVALMDRIATLHDAQFLGADEAAPGTGEPTPIFIVGLPRAGSTLLERILGASSGVTAMGELPDFPKAYMKQVRQLQKEGGAQDPVLLSTRIDFEKLRQNYLACVRARGLSTPYFIDKLPMNFLNIGLIRRALPDARIIHISRAPMAACYSVYKAFFGDGHPYSYDLQELATYYGAYRKLMAHWHGVMPAAALVDVSYESLVTTPEAQGKCIFEFLGLPWSDAFLAVDKADVLTDSASAAQVRQPIHTRAVDAWKAVADELLAFSDQIEQQSAPD